MEYTYGDSLGAYFWTLPSLLDGISIAVIGSGKNLESLTSLYRFIGEWLPLVFYGSVESALIGIAKKDNEIQAVIRKSELCSQYGKIFQPSETGTPVVIFGSKQTGLQFHTGENFNENSDVDWGVVGGPEALAILIIKASNLNNDPKKHCPTKFFSTAEEATEQDCFVIYPQE